MTESPFLTFLHQGIERGGFEVADALAAVLPLMREVRAIHEAGSVASLCGLSAIAVHDERVLGFVSLVGVPREHNDQRISQLLMPASRGLEVVSEARRETDHDLMIQRVTSLDVGEPGAEIDRPVYLADYITWEHAVGHHDELTDIHSLGLILASLMCGLDFTDREDLAMFASSRGNLFELSKRLHPVIAVVITEMTELHRGKRSQDLASVIRMLETYRDQPVDVDMSSLPGLKDAGKGGRRKIIQTHLRDRLFEVSRRNRLLYFKNSQSTLNLTIASVPLVLDYRNVQPEQLLYWHDSLARELSAGSTLPLQRWLRFEEAPYLPGQLDKLISDARRDRAEFGFSQLRLVIAFLRWNNLKEAPGERIHSPLLMLPVDLVKKKGVKDHYTIEPQGTEAEVNPALRHHLKQLYNLDLPEMIDLRETTLTAFHETLRGLIHATEPGISLTFTNKPKIQLVHERARQRMDQYRRRMAKKGRAARSAASLDYSYDRNDFRPLGLQLFQKKVLPSPLPLRGLAGAPPTPRLSFIMPEEAGVMETERKTFSLIEEAQGNPYSWDFDVCSLTLANFNYRKMTLVRDYANLIDHDMASAAFDRVFSIAPKTVADSPPPDLPPSDQYLIIVADATQVGAIARARQGDSLIIQGPPGTGKSQTITNLIADYVARGKRVLFVCEKRAAIDVVFHRLRQQGLDELCCLIHDSQTDKKSFILNLKQTYEQWLAGQDRDGSEERRAAALRTLETELENIQKYVEQMASAPTEAGTSIRELVHRLIELRGAYDGVSCPELSAAEEELLPHYEEWRRHGDAVIRVGEVLQDLGAAPVLAIHPLRWLSQAVITSDAPMEHLASRLDAVEQQLDDLDDALQQTGLPMEHWDILSEVAQLLEFAQRLQPIANRGLLTLLDDSSESARAFAKLCTEHDKKRKALETAQKKTVHWRAKMPPDETQRALAIAQRVEGLLGFFNPARWRLRKVLQASYDFSKQAVKPSWMEVLSDLIAEQAVEAELEALSERCLTEFASENLPQLKADLALLSDRAAPPAVAALRTHLLRSDQGNQLVKTLASLALQFQQLRVELNALLAQPEKHSLNGLSQAIREVREESDALPELLPALRDLAATTDRIGLALRSLPLTAQQFEAASARKTLEHLYRKDRMLQRFDGRLLQQKLDRITRMHRQWLESNATWLRGQVRQRFVSHVQISNQSAAALTPDQKLFKKTYAFGRRELEHEFGKTMRYKSIRDLAAAESGSVVRDLKPIWLMSPLSVSDTLPLEDGLFDVVIFDEASQIPVEEAIPAAYRAPQVIVVGDEMQLPPTSFFSSGGGDDDDEINVEEEGEKISVLMDADSFLTQCARNLPSTLLAWHYRSRYEALISFSNAAFYGGELYTIPDRQLRTGDVGGMRVSSVDEAAAHVPALLSKPISFIQCENSPYTDRRNASEAAVIARLVRGILLEDTKLSIGVAAFSEAQQGEIESAMSALAAEDAEFAGRLEAEYVREEDDQFCGLFVKNLENVQGDERDVILMSVCYGRDPNGRMLMNFGPINQRGGEKRLNVIFSRARHHMAIVSSIRHTDITNDYNDGARALKDFLQYAESSSRGDVGMATAVLEKLNTLKRKALSSTGNTSVVPAQIAEALKKRGWAAQTDMGQSRFRCDVAVRAMEATQYKLAIMVDGPGNTTVLERYHTQPGILQAFGWRVLVVLAKDWWHEPQAVLERIERILHAETMEEPMDDEGVEEIPVEEVAEVPPVIETPESVAPQETETQASSGGVSMQRYEFVEGGSKKFWEIGQQDQVLTIRFGRIGTNGQTQVKTLADEPRAAREMAKLIAEKVKKGYASEADKS